MIGREYSVTVESGGRVIVRRFRAVSPAHARAQALDAFPVVVSIAACVVCPDCRGGFRGAFEDFRVCPSCNGTAWAPESYACCPGEEEHEGAVITLGNERGSFTPPG